MQRKKSKTIALILLLIVTIATGISAIYVSKKLQTDEDIVPDDSFASGPCSISNKACSDSIKCAWPKTAFCTCDSNGNVFSGSECKCVNCYKQRYPSSFNGACASYIPVCDRDPDDSKVPDCLPDWEDCGTSVHRTKYSGKCERMDDSATLVEVEQCNNSTWLYRFCIPPQADVTNTPTATITSSPTNTPTNTPTLKPTDTPYPTDTPPATNTPTNTPSPTATLTNTPTDTPIPTITPSPTATLTPSATPTGTIQPSNTPTITPTPNPSASATPSTVSLPNSLPNSLPHSGIMKDQFNRVIIGIFMIFTGWTVYWFGLESSVKMWLSNIKKTPTYRKFYKKTHPNDKEAFFEKMKKKFEK